MDQFIEDLTCSICFNIYDDPRLLKCSHTFCRNCLESIVRASDGGLWRLSAGRLKCPSCRAITDLSVGVNGLPVNFALKSIVEKYKTSNPASLWTCPRHSGRQLNLFCLKDRRLICSQCCDFGEHQGHPAEDLETAFRKERKTACRFLTTLQNKNGAGISTTVSALEEQLEDCQATIQEDKKGVVAFFDEIIDVIEKKKQGLLAALNDLNQEITDTYAPKIEEMKQIQDDELDLKSLISTTLDEECPLVYFKNIQTIEQGMEALNNQKPMPVYPVEIRPRFGQTLKACLLKTSIVDIHRWPVPKFEFSQVKPRSYNMLIGTLLVVLLLLIVFVLSFLDLNNSVFQYIEFCWSNVLIILEPLLSYCGIQGFTVKSTSQRLITLFHDFFPFRSLY